MAAHGITIDDVLIAVLGAAGLPWEQLPLQGLQPYSQTKSTVHYTISTRVDCSAVSQFTLTAHLPRGFFPKDGSALFSVGTHPASNAGLPTVLGGDAAAAAKLNAYRWTVSCPSGDNNAETAALTFDAWVGLKLGTFTTSAPTRRRAPTRSPRRVRPSPSTRTPRHRIRRTRPRSSLTGSSPATSRPEASRPSTR